MKIESIELVNFGELKTDKENQEISTLSPTGYFLRPGEITFINTSDKIHGILGQKFGIEYYIKGFDKNSDVAIFYCRIMHPEMINPETNTISTVVEEKKINYTNQNNYDYFSFEYDWEIVKGKWVFEITEGKTNLLQKIFQII